MADQLLATDGIDDRAIALEDATGAEPTRLFLQGRIAQHQRAVTMAHAVLENDENVDVTGLAEQMIEGQPAKIATTQSLLAEL